MKYLAAELFAALEQAGCTYEGDSYPTGQAWFTQGLQVFYLPDPDQIDGRHWFDADVIDDNLANRWVGFTVIHLTRYP